MYLYVTCLVLYRGTVFQVLGLSSDACRVKLQAHSMDEANSYTHWEPGATLAANITFIAFAAIKLSVFADKSSGELSYRVDMYSEHNTGHSAAPPLHIHTTPLSSLRSGYQHIHFSDSMCYDLLHPPASLFIHVKVRYACTSVKTNTSLFPNDSEFPHM